MEVEITLQRDENGEYIGLSTPAAGGQEMARIRTPQTSDSQRDLVRFHQIARMVAAELSSGADPEWKINPEVLIDAAKNHALDTGETHDVGDLQDMLEAALEIMSPAQQERFLEDDRVRACLDPTDNWPDASNREVYDRAEDEHAMAPGM